MNHEQEQREEKELIEQMEKNVGRTVTFVADDGTRHYGKITGVSNAEHYTVLLEHNWPWPWYVRKEALNFVELIQEQVPHKI